VIYFVGCREHARGLQNLVTGFFMFAGICADHCPATGAQAVAPILAGSQ
jgi:hypothetical protein